MTPLERGRLGDVLLNGVAWGGTLTDEEERRAIDALIDGAREQRAAAYDERGDQEYDARRTGDYDR